MKKVGLLLIAAMMTCSISGCTTSTTGKSSTTAKAEQTAASTGKEEILEEQTQGKDLSKLKIGFCVAGTLGDESTNDLQHEGIKKFQKETGCTVTALEASEFNDHEINARNFANQGYDLVIMGLAASQDLVVEFAGEYPDTMFWVNQGLIDGMDNVACTRSMPSESNFLTGAFAIYMTEAMGYEKKAGWIGGQRNPALERGQFGFTAGAEYAGGRATIAYIGDFVDTAKGKELANQMYNSGIHIIQGWAGGASTGIMQAAEENVSKDCYCMRGGGVEGDFYMSEGSIIACASENAETILYNVCQSFGEGTLKSGVTYEGLKDGVCNILYNSTALADKIPDSVKEKVDALGEQIKKGELVPPSTEQEYKDFAAKHLNK